MNSCYVIVTFWSPPPCGLRQNSNLTLSCPMQLITRPTTWTILVASIWANILLTSGSRTWSSCRRIFWAVFEIGFRLWSYFSEVWTGTHSFDLINDWWASSRRCSFHWDSWFFSDDLLAVITWWFPLGRIRAGFPFAVSFTMGEFGSVVRAKFPHTVRIFFTRKNAFCLSSNKQSAPSRESEKKIYWNLCWWVPMGKDGDSDLMTPRLQWNAVLPNSLFLYPRLHTNFAFWLLRSSVSSLRWSVHLSALFFQSLVRKYRLWSTSTDKTCLCWHFRNVFLFSLSRARCTEAVRTFQCVRFVRSSVAGYDPSR